MHYLQDVLLVFATIQGIFLSSHLYFSQELVKGICKYFSSICICGVFYVGIRLGWSFITISNGEFPDSPQLFYFKVLERRFGLIETKYLHLISLKFLLVIEYFNTLKFPCILCIF